MSITPKIRIGTRGSPLALAQAHETRDRLMAAHGLDLDAFEIIPFTTTGDAIRDRPLSEIGGKGLFTKELEEALFAGAIDLAVHSMKDLPAKPPAGLDIAAMLPREDARDAFISLISDTLVALPEGAILGSSSVRRTAQALRLRPDLATAPFRGNVQTRLKKLQDGVANATFLAVAGLRRLKLANKITRIMSMDEMLPSVAQGAIGIQINTRDEVSRRLLAPINHVATKTAVLCERGFMATLDGSCRTPIAGHAFIENGRLKFRGEALTLDGRHIFSAMREGGLNDGVKMGVDAGEEVKARGGALISF
ncbi:MAG: hydroxymethylbilane synthase [Alphaproteobacteria bacterium]|nr:hydroxymethylbilane synthase [Alphaproteobacteria bacterium]